VTLKRTLAMMVLVALLASGPWGEVRARVSPPMRPEDGA
jgi:hypothetical protein